MPGRSSTPSVEKPGSIALSDSSKPIDTSSNDGWDDLKDEFVEESHETEEKWEDAKEGSLAEENDWGSGWQAEDSSFNAETVRVF